MKIAKWGHPLTIGQLKLKIFEITQEKDTPFTEGIHGNNWLKWFRHRHPELSLRSLQDLKLAYVKGLSLENVTTFYDNLLDLYREHAYAADHIWNCEEFGAQVGRHREERIFSKKGPKNFIH
jgi:hypothetical protein